jgi:hypothetical protein
MNSLFNVTIDAGVFAVPDADTLEEYVKTLLELKERLKNEPWIVFCVSRDYLKLYDYGLIPSLEQLKKLFSINKIGGGADKNKFSDAQTVSTLLHKFLVEELLNKFLVKESPNEAKIKELPNEFKIFEKYYKIDDVVPEYIKTEPDIINTIADTRLRDDFKRLLAMIADLWEHCPEFRGNHSLFIKNAPENHNVSVETWHHPQMIIHTRDDIKEPASPEHINAEIQVCDDFRGIIDCIDELEMLRKASDDEEVMLAIRIALFKDDVKEGRVPDWKDWSTLIGKNTMVIERGRANIRKLRIGPEFRNTCRKICVDNVMSEKTLRAIVEVVKGRNLKDMHHHEDGGHNARRHKISDGDRLIYLKLPDETIMLDKAIHHE